MMNAMIFDNERDAIRETDAVKAWCAENDPTVVKMPPIAVPDGWAVTFPEGYPATGAIRDINAVPVEEAEL